MRKEAEEGEKISVETPDCWEELSPCLDLVLLTCGMPASVERVQSQQEIPWRVGITEKTEERCRMAPLVSFSLLVDLLHPLHRASFSGTLLSWRDVIWAGAWTSWLLHPFSGYLLHSVTYCSLPAKLLQSCPTLCGAMDCSLPGFSVHMMLQTRTLEWVAIPSSRGSSQPRDWTHISFVSCAASGFFTTEPLGKPPGWLAFISFFLPCM